MYHLQTEKQQQLHKWIQILFTGLIFSPDHREMCELQQSLLTFPFLLEFWHPWWREDGNKNWEGTMAWCQNACFVHKRSWVQSLVFPGGVEKDSRLRPRKCRYEPLVLLYMATSYVPFWIPGVGSSLEKHSEGILLSLPASFLLVFICAQAGKTCK